MPQRLVFTAKQQVVFEEFTPDSVGEKSVAVQTICSLMSTGTENIVFNRLFEPGTHWDRWVKYPFYPGYSAVAEVTQTGPQVKGLKAGDRVAIRCGHASHHVIPEDRCYKVPAGLDPKVAAWHALAKITFMGARAANYFLGDSVLIIGAGPIGQMSIRWASAAGVENIIVTDMVEMRLELAKRGGATAVIAKPIDQAHEAILEANGGKLPKIVIDSTGNAAVFSTALTLAADRGRVVVLGDTGTPSNQQLTSDVITRGLTIAGAHDGHCDATWTEARIMQLFFNLVTSRRFPIDTSLNTHVFAPKDCVKAYETANKQRGQTMGILFDWSN
jgi:2-desacetyl-2-hydroxyethyl bacteriochlorophyllide A dehydrogenase